MTELNSQNSHQKTIDCLSDLHPTSYSVHSYRGISHHHDGLSQKLNISDADIKRVRELNRLDIILYERAREQFESRWNDLIENEPTHLRFVPHDFDPDMAIFTLQAVDELIQKQPRSQSNTCMEIMELALS